MYSGRDAPFISLESVRSALDSIIHVSFARSPSPLEHLLLVDEFLTNPDFPHVKLARQFALNDLLISIIKEEYWRVRIIFGLNHVSEEDARLDHVLQQIHENLYVGSLELSAWSLLYLRYVRSDLGLSLEVLSHFVHIESRTLRRYLRHALEKLTESLIQRELAARRRQRTRRLLSELPSSTAVPLFGRQEIFQEVERFLAKPGRHHILVTGMAGIGKSTFVQEVLREQITGESLDHLLWVQHPPTVIFARHHLIERLLPEGSNISLGEYCLLYRVGIVLDSIGSLEAQRDDLETLLDEISAALVFVTTHMSMPLRNVTRHIVLGELDEPDCVLLARAILGSHPNEDRMQIVYQAIGGNPLAIKLATQAVDYFSLPDDFFTRVFRQLEQRLWQTLCMFALFPPGAVNSYDLGEVWPDVTRQEDIAALARRYLIDEVSHDQPFYALPTSVRMAVEHSYARQEYVKETINNLLYSVNLDSLIPTLNVVEQALLSSWLSDDLEWQHQRIEQLWREGVRQAHCARWCNIFERYFQRISAEDANFLIAYGICLRRLTQWITAERVFQRVLLLTGQAGAFLAQARGMMELGILYRYQGHYENANRLFAQAEDILQSYRDNTITSALCLEQAQIAIELGDAKEALRALSKIENLSPELLVLQSEGYLLTGDWKRSLDLLQRTLEIPGITPRFKAQVHSIIGRSYEKGCEFPLARRHVESAVTLLEQSEDRFALARAQSNLGAILIRGKEYDDAQLLLERAMRVQTQFKDRLGAATTGHNLRLLPLARFESPP